MSITTSSAFINFTNGTPRADKIIATSNIGIGTNAPAYTLDVTGDINFSGSLYENGVAFSGGGGGGGSGIDTTQTLALSNATTGLIVSSNAVVTGNVTSNHFISEYLTTSNITAYSTTNNTPPQQTQVITKYDTSSDPISSGYVQDTSGQSRNGQIVGTVTYNSTDKSLDFSGTNSYTQVFFDGSALNNAHTISLWVKLNGTPSNYAAIFAMGDRYTGADNGEVSLFWNPGTQDFYYSFVGGSNNHNLFASPDPLINTWYNIVLTYDGNNKKFYVNGVLNSSGTTTVCNIPSTNCVLRLNGDAANSNSTHQSQPTSISNFKLYDVALTSSEVSTLYSFGRNDETAAPTGIINFTNTNVGIGVTNPLYNLHVDGITRLNAYSGSSSGTFSGSGTFYLPPDLDAGGYAGSPHIAWELHLVFGFTGTTGGNFYISGSQDTSSSVVNVSEPGCRVNRPSGSVSNYSTCYFTPSRETQASGYYAIIRLGQAGTDFNIPKLSSVTANRFHFMYHSVGCWGGIGASTVGGQGFFAYPSNSRRPKYIRVTCSTGSVQGNWMLKKITI